MKLPPWMNLFRSIRFNVGLFLLLTLAAAIGTLVPQITETPEKVDLFLRSRPFWGWLFKNLGFFNVYRSPWFVAMLSLMAFDIVVCKLGKTPPDPGLVSLPPELEKQRASRDLAETIAQKPFFARVDAHAAPAAAIKKVRAALTRRGFHVHRGAAGAKSDDASVCVATRHPAQRWGSYVAHVALVVILLGGLVKILFGFEEMVPVAEGGSRPLQTKPDIELAVDKFTVEYYPGTLTPRLFASELRVLEKGQVVAQKRLTVNDPLSWRGLRFYQATWGAGGMFKSATLRFKDLELDLKQRAPQQVPGLPIRAVADVMLPDFQIGADGRADTQSLDLKNPAVKMYFEYKGHRTRPLWMLVEHPNTAFTEDDGGVLQHTPAPPFRISRIDPVLFSGIQVGSDPGFALVAGGSIAWLAGMIMLFYLHRRRVWALAQPAGRATELLIGGWSSRKGEYRKEFDDLVAEVKG